MEILNKISAKTCKAIPKMILVEVDGKQVPRADGEQHLLRIVGMANGTKTGNSEYGKWTAFLGTFEATNVQTGQVFRSSKCLLPESLTGQLSVAVDSAPEGSPVQFAVDIGVKPAKTPTGYEYTVKPLLEVGASDPLELMKSQVVLPALPAISAPALTDETHAATKTGKKK